jgi:hypothetical protein
MTAETINGCCDRPPQVFELRPSNWVVHCWTCWEMAGPCKSRNKAIKKWNDKKDRRCK